MLFNLYPHYFYIWYILKQTSDIMYDISFYTVHFTYYD